MEPENPVNFRSRSISIKGNGIRDDLARGRMRLLYVNTTSQLADSLTKVVGPQIATKHHHEMRLVDVEVDSETRHADS
eukprot:1909833-Amphidinium_carterae.1